MNSINILNSLFSFGRNLFLHLSNFIFKFSETAHKPVQCEVNCLHSFNFLFTPILFQVCHYPSIILFIRWYNTLFLTFFIDINVFWHLADHLLSSIVNIFDPTLTELIFIDQEGSTHILVVLCTLFHFRGKQSRGIKRLESFVSEEEFC